MYDVVLLVCMINFKWSHYFCYIYVCVCVCVCINIKMGLI